MSNVLFPRTPTHNIQHEAQHFMQQGAHGYMNTGMSAASVGAFGSMAAPQQQQQHSNGIRVDWKAAFTAGGFEGEPPLLEELEVNFAHIRTKAFAALNPLRPIDKHLMDDTDLAGPLLFTLLFGIFSFLAGKAQFNYIYGIAVLGCLSMYMLLNLMSESGIDSYTTASVLGYCLLPMVVLSMFSVLLGLNGWLGSFLVSVAIVWCTYSSSTMFVTVLSMTEQRLLVAYPVCLLYAVFALMVMF